MTKRSELKEFNKIIQICDCGKVDAHKDDGHNCGVYIIRREEQESRDE